MNECVLALNLSGADLSTVGDSVIMDVIVDTPPPVDSALSDASTQAGDALEIETGTDRAILILVGRLGYGLIQNRLGHTPTLRRMRDDICSIHAVISSTTAAAITAFGIDTRPSAANMVGFSAAYGGGIMSLLAMEGGSAPTRRWPTPTYFECLAAAGASSAVILSARFAGPGLVGAAPRGARHVPAEQLSDRMSAALCELRAGTPVVYLYWSETDHAGHSSDIGSDAWIGCLEEFGMGLSALLRNPSTGARTIMIADHGMINVEHSVFVNVVVTPALREGVRVITGEI